MLEYYFFEVNEMNTFKDAKELLLLPNKIWAAIALAGTLIILGKPITSYLKFSNNLYDWIGVPIFIATMIAYAILIVSLWLHYWNRIRLKLAIRSWIKRANSLDANKKKIVRQLYQKDDHVMSFPIGNYHILYLKQANIIAKTPDPIVTYPRLHN